MTVSRYCRKPVITITPEATVHDAAGRMKDLNVGCLVVVDEDARPVGMLTDRDVALNVTGNPRRPEKTKVGDVMSREVVTLREDASLEEATALMRDSAYRRLPVVDKRGRLEGVLAADDLVIGLSHELHDLAEGLRRQVWSGERASLAPTETHAPMQTAS